MEADNQTLGSGFILMGFPPLPCLQATLFSVFSLFYSATLVGNVLIILIIRSDSRLHTPMYFFLCNFSLLDILNPSVTIPRMLSDLLSETKSISHTACITQIFFYIFFASVECSLLSVMAFDRYAAVCQPLHYHAIMNWGVCTQLAAATWVSGCLYSMMHTVATSRLTFCGSKTINHFFCDVPPLLLLACSDTTVNMVIIYICVVILGVGNAMVTLSSYIHIISTILKIQSKDGRMKTFSTCGSHLAVVSLYYGSLIGMYFRPMSSYAMSKAWMASVIYTSCTPMLNPLIYSLRNNEVKGALRRMLGNKELF
ncbi:olfactory receptor 5V1-like [Ambystoma mexicanum]|uniref:olfactory receptor 5V1-like n=1 Tax=Ambystoma mexicanum TaxID=8296 RepID=UPI0037E7E630